MNSLFGVNEAKRSPCERLDADRDQLGNRLAFAIHDGIESLCQSPAKFIEFDLKGSSLLPFRKLSEERVQRHGAEFATLAGSDVDGRRFDFLLADNQRVGIFCKEASRIL